MQQTLVLGPRALKAAAEFIDWLVMNGLARELVAPAVDTFAKKLAGKKPPAPPSGVGAETHAVFNEYDRLYALKHKGEPPPPPTGAEAVIVTRLVKLVGAPVVNQRLKLMADLRDDDWIVKDGFTLIALNQHWKRLAGLAQKRTGREPDATQTSAYLKEIKGDGGTLQRRRTDPSA